MDEYTRKLEQENFALKAELEQHGKALEMAIDGMGDDSCPYEYDYVNKPECENCPHDHEIHVDTERDVRCWKDYFLQQAEAGDQHEPDGQD